MNTHLPARRLPKVESMEKTVERHSEARRKNECWPRRSGWEALTAGLGPQALALPARLPLATFFSERAMEHACVILFWENGGRALYLCVVDSHWQVGHNLEMQHSLTLSFTHFHMLPLSALFPSKPADFS